MFVFFPNGHIFEYLSYSNGHIFQNLYYIILFFTISKNASTEKICFFKIMFECLRELETKLKKFDKT
jgi:hypothetical protein